MRQPTADSDEVAAYRAEVEQLVLREHGKLDAQLAELDRMEALEPASRDVLEDARGELRRAGERLHRLTTWLSKAPANEAFDAVIPRAVAAFRSSTAARCLLQRHTPTLCGFPSALDPAQSHRLKPGS